MLEEIAKEVCKKKHITSMMDCIYIKNSETKETEIGILSDKKRVVITKPEHYDAAYNLALAYETYGGEKWTLKTDYNE